MALTTRILFFPESRKGILEVGVVDLNNVPQIVLKGFQIGLVAESNVPRSFGLVLAKFITDSRIPTLSFCLRIDSKLPL